jgi:hypothetical protein
MFMKNKSLIAANLECYRNKRRSSLDARSRKIAGRWAPQEPDSVPGWDGAEQASEKLLTLSS